MPLQGSRNNICPFNNSQLIDFRQYIYINIRIYIYQYRVTDIDIDQYINIDQRVMTETRRAQIV